MIRVLIPTYNRPKCIELLLRECINVYQGELFKFTILDSSPDNRTEKLVNNSCKVEYKRFDTDVPVDDKVIGAIMDCCEDYYWLLGDGNLVDFNSFEKLIDKAPKFDVLEVDSSNSKRNTKSLYDEYEIHEDLLNFIKARYSHLTYWGASIVKTESVKGIFKSHKMDKYREDTLSWWSAALVCEMISTAVENEMMPRISTIYTKCFSFNPEKKDRSWAKGENYFLTTFKVFDKDVYMLPKYFDEVKNDIIRIFRDDFLVTKSYLIDLRMQNVIKLKYVMKYKDEIQHVRGYFPFIFVLACIPMPCLEIAYSIHKLLKGDKQ